MRTPLFENNREDLIDMSDERTAAIVRDTISEFQFTYGEYSMVLPGASRTALPAKCGRHSRREAAVAVCSVTGWSPGATEIGFGVQPAGTGLHEVEQRGRTRRSSVALPRRAQLFGL